MQIRELVVLHIPFRVLFAAGKRMNECERDLFYPLFWSPYAYGKLYQKFNCLSAYKKVYFHPSLLLHSNIEMGPNLVLFEFLFFFLMPLDFKSNYSL